MFNQTNFIDKYKNFVVDNLSGKSINSYSFTEEELLEFQQQVINFYSLVSYENSHILKNEKILRNAFLDGKFLIDKYMLGTTNYREFESQDRGIKKLQVGDVFERANTSYGYLTPIKHTSIYEKTPNSIKRYIKVEPYDGCIREFRNMNFNDVKRAFSDKERTDVSEEKFIIIQNGQEVIIQKNKNGVDFIISEEQENPFFDGHFRFFVKGREVKDFSKTNFSQLYYQMRSAEAHHSIYNYCNGKPYGGKVFDLGTKVVLLSNRWHEKIYNMIAGPYEGRGDFLNLVYIPRGTRPVKNAQELEQKLSSCKVVEIYFSKEVDMYEARQYARNYLDLIAVNNSTNVIKYLKEKLQPTYGNVGIFIKNFENSELVKARLDNSGYYKTRTKDSECIASQNHILRAIIEDIYGFDIVSKDVISNAGKVRPLKIDMRDFKDYLLSDMHNIQATLGYTDTIDKSFEFAYPEKFISLCMFIAYSNLVKNQYLDNINELNLSSVKGFVDSGERGKQKIDLQAVDMSMFTIKKITGKKDRYEPKTLNDRITVIRAIRNSISHNGLLIQYSKNANIHDSKFVFTLAKHPELQIKVNCDDFLKFVSNPIFSDYRADEIQNINASTNAELEKEIQKLLSGDYDKVNQSKEWAEE